VLIEGYKFESCKGIHFIVSERRNFSQNWCPNCLSEDVTFKNATSQLFCDECNFREKMSSHFGLGALIDQTAELLPDLAKEAFLSSQQVSLQEKDKRAKVIVKQLCKEIAIDVSGKALNQIGEMVGKIFILWGWNFLGNKISGSLIKEMSTEYKKQELTVRLAMVAADTILRHKLSRSVIACLGIMVNKPLRQLSQQLLELIDKNIPIDAKAFNLSVDADSQQFSSKFMQMTFERGIDDAIDKFWN